MSLFCTVLFFLLFFLFFTSGSSGQPSDFTKHEQQSVFNKTKSPEKISILSISDELILEPITSVELVNGPAFQTADISEDRSNFLTPVHEISRTIPSLWQIRIPADVHPTSLDVNYELVAFSGKPNHLSHIDQPDSEIYVFIEPIGPNIVGKEERTVVEEKPADEREEDTREEEEQPEAETEEATTEEEEQPEADIEDGTIEEEEQPKTDTKETTTNTIVRVETTLVVEGGVIFRFYPKNVKYAGSYLGTLTITINGI